MDTEQRIAALASIMTSVEPDATTGPGSPSSLRATDEITLLDSQLVERIAAELALAPRPADRATHPRHAAAPAPHRDPGRRAAVDGPARSPVALRTATQPLLYAAAQTAALAFVHAQSAAGASLTSGTPGTPGTPGASGAPVAPGAPRLWTSAPFPGPPLGPAPRHAARGTASLPVLGAGRPMQRSPRPRTAAVRPHAMAGAPRCELHQVIGLVLAVAAAIFAAKLLFTAEPGGHPAEPAFGPAGATTLAPAYQLPPQPPLPGAAAPR